MQLSEEAQHTPYRIRRYQPGELVINETTYQDSLILTTDEVFTSWPVNDIANLSADHLAMVITHHPDVFILGTGNKQVFPAQTIMADIINANIGYEIMDTQAACRTYNLLVNEKRNVLAALII